MNTTPYNLAYCIGYYYGRALPEGAPVAEQDQYHMANKGFHDGLAVGRHDFQTIDLAAQALGATPEN